MSRLSESLKKSPGLFTALGLILFTFAGVFAIDVTASAYIQRIIIGLGISIILVVALNLSNGFTGVFSLGHVGFMAIGAYAAAILTMPLAQKKVNLPDLPPFLAVTEINFLTATIIAGLIAAIIALFVGISLMRLNGPYVSVATMGFLVIVQVVLINWDSLTLGARTFSGVPDYSNLYWVWTWVIVAVYVVWRIGKSSFGRAMIATRENEIAAQSLGINVMRSRLIAFCVSAFFTAVAGSLWAHFIMSFSPKSFYFSQAFNIITMMVVGGAGSVSGSVIGATTITILSEILRNAERGVDLGFIKIPPVYGASQILMSVMFILVIIFRPGGIMGGKEIQFNRLWTGRKKASSENSQKEAGDRN